MYSVKIRNKLFSTIVHDSLLFPLTFHDQLDVERGGPELVFEREHVFAGVVTLGSPDAERRRVEAGLDVQPPALAERPPVVPPRHLRLRTARERHVDDGRASRTHHQGLRVEGRVGEDGLRFDRQPTGTPVGQRHAYLAVIMHLLDGTLLDL